MEIYLNFDGNAKEAAEFYADVFHTTPPTFMYFKDIPNPEHPIPPEVGVRVLHAKLDVRGQSIMFSDTMPGMEYIIGNNIHVAHTFDSEAETREAFNRFSEHGKIVQELQPTFFSPCYGQVMDSFGISWLLLTR